MWVPGSVARGIFLAQGPNPRLLHWEAGSSPLDLQGSPGSWFCLITSWGCVLWGVRLGFIGQHPENFSCPAKYFNPIATGIRGCKENNNLKRKFIEVSLTYHILLVWGVQQSDSYFDLSVVVQIPGKDWCRKMSAFPLNQNSQILKPKKFQPSFLLTFAFLYKKEAYEDIEVTRGWKLANVKTGNEKQGSCLSLFSV